MSGPAPQVAAIRSALRSELADIGPGATVVVACSGGQDSLALAAGLGFVAARAKNATLWRTMAVIIDHGLQPGSAEVAARAAQQCLDVGLDEVEVVSVSVSSESGLGVEASARDARYAAIMEVVARLGAAAVLTGHTLDDQAETVLLRLARGSGARSLSGIPSRRGLIRRPLLGIRRRDTLAACLAQGLEPWHDPTNSVGDGGLADPNTPSRSRVRAWLAEQAPVLSAVVGQDVIPALARTADQLRDDADLLDALARELLVSVELPGPGALPSLPESRFDSVTRLSNEDLDSEVRAEGLESRFVGVSGVADANLDSGGRPLLLDVGRLCAAPTSLRRRVIRLAAQRVGCPPGDLGYSHVLTVDALLTDYRGQGKIVLPGNVSVWRRNGTVNFGSSSQD